MVGSGLDITLPRLRVPSRTLCTQMYNMFGFVHELASASWVTQRTEISRDRHWQRRHRWTTSVVDSAVGVN